MGGKGAGRDIEKGKYSLKQASGGIAMKKRSREMGFMMAGTAFILTATIAMAVSQPGQEQRQERLELAALSAVQMEQRTQESLQGADQAKKRVQNRVEERAMIREQNRKFGKGP